MFTAFPKEIQCRRTPDDDQSNSDDLPGYDSE
jgi:hypothetical protein